MTRVDSSLDPPLHCMVHKAGEEGGGGGGVHVATEGMHGHWSLYITRPRL